ncbi:MAG: holo-ACP synthase [Clostridiales bacterium]|nr:holo-ACP synthase [Clostridiales bacterium]MCF8023519.1 holo-ACP synthase [Clostridiales bacterium]
MINGIGTDIVDITRVYNIIERRGDKFLQRVFTSREIAYCEGHRQRSQCYAARFAAKEAVLKALGTGLSGCCWTDVEITRDARGKPEVLLYGGAAGAACENKVKEVLISISHDGNSAVAFAAALGVKGDVFLAGSDSC